VKAAIFSSLGSAIIDARVLDLFAEAARSGLNALTAGAASCSLCRGDRQSTEAIEKNLAKTKLGGPRAPAGSLRIPQAVFRARKIPNSFFADPPYEKNKIWQAFTERLLTNKELAQLLELDGVFVLKSVRLSKLLRQSLGYRPGAKIRLRPSLVLAASFLGEQT